MNARNITSCEYLACISDVAGRLLRGGNDRRVAQSDGQLPCFVPFIGAVRYQEQLSCSPSCSTWAHLFEELPPMGSIMVLTWGKSE